MIVSGACHCGQIKFEAEVEPSDLMICHCTDCQTLTGSAFRAAVPASPQNFRLIEGEPRIYLKIAESGSRRHHAFCGNCGTPVYRMPTDNNPNYALRIGNLDQRLDFGIPTKQIWTASRLPWVTQMSAIPETEKQG